MIKYGLGTVPYDESASACDGVGSRIGHRRKIRLLPPCCHLIPSAGGDALPRVRRSMSTRFFHLPFLDVPRRIARERVPTRCSGGSRPLSRANTYHAVAIF